MREKYFLFSPGMMPQVLNFSCNRLCLVLHMIEEAKFESLNYGICSE